MMNIFGFSFPEPDSVLPEVPILVVGDDNTKKALAIQTNTKDKWLEPELNKYQDKTYPIWEKDKVWLMDARAVFFEFDKNVTRFTRYLNKLSEAIR